MVSYPLTVNTNGTILFEVQGVVRNSTESYRFFLVGYIQFFSYA